MAKRDYSKIAQDIIGAVGGKENVKALTHCVTRVRFTLADESLASDEKVNSIDGVMQVIHSGGQYQVVVGTEVDNIFKAIQAEGNFSDKNAKKDDGDASDDKLVDAAKKRKAKKGPLNAFLGLMSSLFAPVLGILTASGMIKALVVILNLCGVLPKDCGAYLILNAAGDACLYFFPVVLGWSAAKKFEMKEVYGIVLGAVMVYPTIISAVTGDAVSTLFSGTFLEMNVQTDFFGIPTVLRDYSTTVIPIILLIWVSSKLYKWLNNVLPSVLRAFFVPFFTLLISAPLGILIIGPAAMVIQNAISSFVQFLVGLNAGIAGLILGSFWSILVMFGLHWAVIPFFAINIAQYGYDVINPLIYAGAIASMGSVLGLIIKEKDAKERSIQIPALISTFFGINEPALYGVLIPRKKVMLTCFLSAGIGGAIAGFCGAKLWAFGASGILGTPCFINPNGIDMGFIGLMVGAAAAFVVAFVTALIIGPKKDAEK